MNKYHEIEKVDFEKEKLILRVDGKQYAFSLADISKSLLMHLLQKEKNMKFRHQDMVYIGL